MHRCVVLTFLYITLIYNYVKCFDVNFGDFKNLIQLRIFGEDFNTYDTYDFENAEQAFQSKYYNKNKPTAIYFHGWSEGFDTASTTIVIPALIKLGRYNNMAYDYSQLVKSYALNDDDLSDYKQYILNETIFGTIAEAVGYTSSSANTSVVGHLIGFHMNTFIKKYIKADQLYLISHSLGCHVAGFAGKIYNLINNNQNKIGRHTCLDAAGPFFENTPSFARLSKNDAKVVDVLHTNIYLAGITGAIGTVDFFANSGGPEQPACTKNDSIVDSASCSHRTSCLYFSEAIFNPERFPAKKCTFLEKIGPCNASKSEILLFGGNISAKDNGQYYFTTNAKPPYGKGKAGLN